MFIEDIMCRTVAGLTKETLLAKVITWMHENQFSCCVIADGVKPLGIITERCIVDYLSAHKADHDCLSITAEEVMSTPPVTLCYDETVLNSVAIARARNIRHIIAVDGNGDMVGLVTQTDLISAHLTLIEQQNQIIETTVKERTIALDAANKQLKALTLEDPMMGIGNRRAMELDLAHSQALYDRHGRPYTVVLFDIDNFKKYNDHYGHIAGDKALISVGHYLKEIVRKSDRVYRYGGEELLVLLAETELDGAFIFAQRIVKGIEALNIPHTLNIPQVVTVSCGVACANEEKGWKESVKLADSRLYQAKENGRNQASKIAS